MKFLDFCDVPGWRKTFVKLLKIRPNFFFFYYVQFLLCLCIHYKCFRTTLTSTWQNFNNQFIILRHQGTFSENLKINCRIVCYSIVTDFMCIYCHYRLLKTRSSLDIARFHQIYNFKILRHPGTFKVVQYKKSYKATNISIKLSFQSLHYIHWVI